MDDLIHKKDEEMALLKEKVKSKLALAKYVATSIL